MQDFTVVTEGVMRETQGKFDVLWNLQENRDGGTGIAGSELHFREDNRLEFVVAMDKENGIWEYIVSDRTFDAGERMHIEVQVLDVVAVGETRDQARERALHRFREDMGRDPAAESGITINAV